MEENIKKDIRMKELLESLFFIYLPLYFGYFIGRADFHAKKNKKFEILGEDFLRVERLKNRIKHD